MDSFPLFRLSSFGSPPPLIYRPNPFRLLVRSAMLVDLLFLINPPLLPRHESFQACIRLSCFLFTCRPPTWFLSKEVFSLFPNCPPFSSSPLAPSPQRLVPSFQLRLLLPFFTVLYLPGPFVTGIVFCGPFRRFTVCLPGLLYSCLSKQILLSRCHAFFWTLPSSLSTAQSQQYFFFL